MKTNSNYTIEVKSNWETISTFNYKFKTKKALRAYVAFLASVWGFSKESITIIIHGTSFCQPPMLKMK